MHETSVAREILEIVAKEAAENGAPRVLGVRIRAGAFSHIDAGALRFAFDALKEETAASGAVLEVERARVSGTCGSCRATFEAENLETSCPGCGGMEIRWDGEPHVHVVSIDVDD